MPRRKRRTDGLSYRKFDDCWYAMEAGQRVPLRDESGQKIRGPGNEKAAKLALYRHSLKMARPGDDITFADAALGYLHFLRRERTGGSFNLAKRRLESAATFFGVQTAAKDVTAEMVLQWSNLSKWTNNTRRHALGCIRACYRHNRMDSPTRGIEFPALTCKTEIFTPDQLKLLLDTANRHLRDFCWFLSKTGCRPGEARRLCARHYRPGDHGEFILPPDEHKSGRKTGKSRHIFLTYAATAWATRMIKLRPDGPLLRNRSGRPWSAKQVELAFRRLRRRCGLGDRFSLHTFRHTFATRHIDNGVPIERVATWLGDSVATVERVYWHAIHVANKNLYQGLDS